MAYRYTNTDKWNDGWFSDLSPLAKLLFIYLFENCDIGGFIEINFKRWIVDIGADYTEIKGALKELGRGLIYSESKDCLFIRNFLKHQKNYPLNLDKNPAHRGIMKRFDLYKEKFKSEIIDSIIKRGFEGASEGLSSPTGNGNVMVMPEKGYIGEKHEETVIPSQDEVIEYFTKNGFARDVALKAHDAFTFCGGRDSQGKIIKDWKEAMKYKYFKKENVRSEVNINR